MRDPMYSFLTLCVFDRKETFVTNSARNMNKRAKTNKLIRTYTRKVANKIYYTLLVSAVPSSKSEYQIQNLKVK